jgi:hypothetical protein
MKQDLKIKKMLWHPAGNLLSKACTLPEACTISNQLGTIVLIWGGEPILP